MSDTQPKGHGAGEEETQADWQQALEYMQENPRTVIGGVLFVLICIAAGGIFSLQKMVKDKEVMTDYATALDEEDAGIRASELQRIAQDNNRWSVEARYLAGEASIEAKAYDDARSAFEEIVSDHPDSEYAAPAAEGLAFLDENAGELEKALAGYTQVFEDYSDTFIGRRQPFNIARVHEALGQLPEAIEFYQRQSEAFPESIIAGQANQALARLETAHPELFPEEETADATDGHDHSEEGHTHDGTVPAGDAAVEAMDEHDHSAEGHTHEAPASADDAAEGAPAAQVVTPEAAPEAEGGPAPSTGDAPEESEVTPETEVEPPADGNGDAASDASPSDETPAES